MKVKMLVGMEGPATSRKRGEVHDVEDAEALRLIAAGYAERAPGLELVPPAQPESAAFAQPEAAVLPASRTRRPRGTDNLKLKTEN